MERKKERERSRLQSVSVSWWPFVSMCWPLFPVELRDPCPPLAMWMRCQEYWSRWPAASLWKTRRQRLPPPGGAAPALGRLQGVGGGAPCDAKSDSVCKRKEKMVCCVLACILRTYNERLVHRIEIGLPKEEVPAEARVLGRAPQCRVADNTSGAACLFGAWRGRR